MPFDGIELSGTEQLVKLGEVERLLATEQQWCKGRLRDAHGRHCLVGAIEAVEGRQMLQRVVLQAAREVSGKRYWRIEFFNDDPHTTHADVLESLRRARENIIAGMICDPQPWHRKWAGALRTLFSPKPDSGAALRVEKGGYRPRAGEPAVFPRPYHAYACADRELREERAREMELQD
jgi:hypothetical protein